MRRALLGLSLLASPALAQENGSGADPGLLAPGGIVLFYNTSAPLSFVSMTAGQLPPGAVPIGEIQGKTCQHGLSIPLSASIRATSLSAAAGDAGYRKTLAKMRQDRPELAGIYDVKVDLQTLSILGIYKRVCTVIAARAFKKG